MTINNHPAHGPVSLDRLHQISEILSKAAAQSDGGNLGYAMADAVKVIDGAIAARSVETIYQVMYGECWRDITEEQYHDHAIHESPIRIVYTAPPASVVHDDLLSMAASAIEDLLEHTDPSTSYYSGVWADVPGKLRAAIQSFGNSEQLDEVGSWNNHMNTPTAQAGNSPVTPDGWQLVPKEPTAAMNKAGWDAMNEHDAINPTYRAMLAAAPQQENV
ncbi:hypothetical protein [Citrobacter freundii]|uniref:hypothetical protein n=1 Tax=Citrobacter freundii TaxID=546 RepID=UPI0015FA7971|nr:hypothetical protein [Citrobacter freundii]MBA8045468.1 hypothetical protein [Citrobacter freundii]